jgi:hypothetical protein
MKTEKQIQLPITMFQLICDHKEKSVRATQIASRDDMFLMWGVAFEENEELFDTMKQIIKLYSKFKKEENQ